MANSVQRVAIYARVSTTNGHQDPEMQLRELREYAEHRGLTIAGEYVDRMTGSKDSRPALNGCPAWFGDFSGTTGLSDFPGPFVIGVRP